MLCGLCGLAERGRAEGARREGLVGRVLRLSLPCVTGMAVLWLRVTKLGVTELRVERLRLAELRVTELRVERRLIAELLAGVTRLRFAELLFAGIAWRGFAELLLARVARRGFAELEVAGLLVAGRLRFHRLAGLRVAVERSAEGVGAAAAHPGLLVVVVERGREDRVFARPVGALAVRIGGRWGLE
ncbi:hypothetical protein [Acrocarpospora sp. B8E8]|uniref:hypothetical protein n=1 Tax=Acrocarpospora sp. B8E8 TaxID=3153572 RepID=UPI00325F0EEF